MIPVRLRAKEGKTWRFASRASVLVAALALSGCAIDSQSRRFAGRPVIAPSATESASAAAALSQAQELDRRGQQQAVDLYYRSAVHSARAIDETAALPASGSQIETVYRQALSGLVDAGQRYRRLDPRRQLIVVDGGTRVVPLQYYGFAWRPDDFSRLTPAERHKSGDIAHHFASDGLGVPLLGERVAASRQETFFRPWQPFAVTAILRPAAGLPESVETEASSQYVLELYNPLAIDSVAFSGAARPLARDLTAPLAAIVNEAPRQYLRGFTAPTDTSVQPQLVLLEPYQRGKIPVIFIHGLYSDPITWVDLINELRVQPDLYKQYQFWTYRYPTGGDLLASAAALRQRMQLVRDSFDPNRSDRAMDAVVLVGHSLGGLVSKLQVTTSYDLMWREVAQQPFTALRATPETHSRLVQAFFFQPTPTVKRVIFIGTPHRGSGMARRLAGRIGSALVSFGEEEDDNYRQLIEENPQVFKPSFSRRRPTTIDLLEPDSPLLTGLARMPVNGATHLHSIIGTGGANPFAEPGDGVVTVSSARHCGESEFLVPTTHENVHRHPAAVGEVARILRLHVGTVP